MWNVLAENDATSAPSSALESPGVPEQEKIIIFFLECSYFALRGAKVAKMSEKKLKKRKKHKNRPRLKMISSEFAMTYNMENRFFWCF